MQFDQIYSQVIGFNRIQSWLYNTSGLTIRLQSFRPYARIGALVVAFEVFSCEVFSCEVCWVFWEGIYIGICMKHRK